MTVDEEETQFRDPRVATVLAVNLVRQVLDEAYIIANAAQDSGQPWEYVSGLRKLRNCSIVEQEYDQKSLPYLVANQKYVEAKLFKTPSKIATSTPQKTSGGYGNSTNSNEYNLIGQGDEEFIGDTDESKSTSIFITNLFDMSDVERDLNISEPDLIEEKAEPRNLIFLAMKKIMDSFVESAIDTIAERDELQRKESEATITSSYSFLNDANNYEYGESSNNTNVHENSKEVTNAQALDKKDFSRYENAFLTLNRDYEPYSDDEEPVLQDPKGLSLQEIELMTRGSSGDILPQPKETNKKEFAAISGVSSSGLGSKKSSIVRRCRTQGARLLACLRGWWWKRKVPGKRRETRNSVVLRGICPLSPEARRRTASLLDHRQLRSPSPSRSVIWKFNTINEALVHSAQWKEFSANIDDTEIDN